MTIAEVSEKFDVSQDTLRYYERIGLIPRVNRYKSGIRDYTEEDCKWVEFNMKKTLERLDYKIASYEQTVVEKEKALRRPED